MFEKGKNSSIWKEFSEMMEEKAAMNIFKVNFASTSRI
jgi:hypothetical protein